MRISVLGGGNGGYAAAADLSEQGHEVRFWRRSANKFDLDNGGLNLRLLDHSGERPVRVSHAGADMATVIHGAQLIVFPGPATAQLDVARLLAPHLADGQVLFLPPGTLGSIAMMRELRQCGCNAKVCIGETGTLPYLARMRASDLVAIARRATRLPTGFFPAANDAEARAIIAQAFPAIEPCEDALSAALMNAGPIIHPPLILMNAGPIQHFEQWDIHNEGTQPAIRAVTSALDTERIALREVLGYAAPHFPLADHYAVDGDESMYGRAAHEPLTESGDWRERLDLHQHRYMREDVALGLALLVSCAQWAGVKTPIADGLLALGGTICSDDFLAGPRTMAALGLNTLSGVELSALLVDGI